ncbi:MAG: helix-turn-helix transcriptional regulator [Hydrogenibacillus schlegelii]|uniref:Helix-turn-helix transcriptional regulator n=2 Tax=Hydrogenibacillus schlegelii TaxID=1484 RepID=A0A947CZD0_HYDSH|nr:helix-turn-helix transcriptional regulator [Hydrogenibacillus schlegelii]
MGSPSEERIPGREPTFLATEEEIAEVLAGLRGRNIRPPCGSRQDRSPDVSLMASRRLLSFIARLHRRYRHYAKQGMFFPDSRLIVTDPELRVIAVIHPVNLLALEGKGGERADERRRILPFDAFPELKPGDALDEASYGLNAFVLAKRSRRLRAVPGLVHTCPQFRQRRTVAVPFGSEPLGVTGLVFSAHRDPYGYAGWLIEVVEQIERELQAGGGEAERGTLSESEKEGERAGFLEKTLTVREREVLDLVLEGLSDEAIAQKLHISVWTVRTHRKNMYRKLGVSTLRDLMVKMKGWRSGEEKYLV